MTNYEKWITELIKVNEDIRKKEEQLKKLNLKKDKLIEDLRVEISKTIKE